MNEIQTKISALTGKLMDDYGKGRVIDEIKMFAYPDRNIIIDMSCNSIFCFYITECCSHILTYKIRFTIHHASPNLTELLILENLILHFLFV